jgi:hypothetical protein
MDDSAANGKAGTLRERIAHNQADRERAIAKLEGSDWEVEADEIRAEHLIEAMQAGAAAVTEATGRHKPVKASDPPPSSVTPKMPWWAGLPLAMVKSVNNFYALGALALLVVALYIWLTKR